MSVAGKIVVITGASSGIGKSIAEVLSSNGANVCLGARREEKLKELTDAINGGDKGKATFCVTDVTNREQVVGLVKHAEEHFGKPVDVLINNAGVMPLSFFRNLHQDEWDRMIDVNIKGVLNGIAAVLPGMTERKSGDIINISSDAGRKLFPGGAVYCGTKWAVEAITQGLRQETAGSNIRILSIQPGATSSELGNSITDPEVFEMFKKDPLDRFLDSVDVANAVLYALQQPEHCAVNEILVRPTCQR
eukprot:CAMPEP_0206188246 /NCGR_PEP_ID=MMETSP0166-20121206/3462_1 /ASSEMBLY_ACC=CAM_ASM_000260 /TAXON_ID=95228 /ORGANISM="Vannella robusta, Strain DIVA3 518/3/11/1/6" /LENGTH=247 /DNA_ID=CAMNT_0053603941 /DNA_START=53 /DNA_END=792 /DNA_ORIENTATION=+